MGSEMCIRDRGDVLHLVVQPVVVGVGLIEQGVVHAEEIYVFVKPVENTPIDGLFVAEHVVIGLEGDGYLVVPVDDVIVLTTVGATRLIADDGEVGVRVQAVVGQTDALGRDVVGQITAFGLAEGVGLSLIHL